MSKTQQKKIDDRLSSHHFTWRITHTIKHLAVMYLMSGKNRYLPLMIYSVGGVTWETSGKTTVLIVTGIS